MPSRSAQRQRWFPTSPAEDPRELELRCNACGTVATYEVGHVIVHPDLEKCRAEGWDGLFLGRIIVCKSCSAEDDYTLGGDAHLALMGQTLGLVASRVEADERTGFQIGVANLWDGTTVRRASQGLAILREAAASQPARADRWRRLGNFALRCGSRDEAEMAYRKAVEADGREAEAAHSLAEMLWESGRIQESAPFVARTIERLCNCDSPPDLRFEMARSALGMVRTSLGMSREPLALMAAWARGTTPAGDPLVSLSSVNLCDLSDDEWERLAELLADEDTCAARLTRDLPEPGERTQLAALIGREEIPGLRPYLPSPPGKNRPCPCGSGKKRKVCCDRQDGPSRRTG